jgi:high-affinity Fe2+/Pb2+ permease
MINRNQTLRHSIVCVSFFSFFLVIIVCFFCFLALSLKIIPFHFCLLNNPIVLLYRKAHPTIIFLQPISPLTSG